MWKPCWCHFSGILKIRTTSWLSNSYFNLTPSIPTTHPNIWPYTRSRSFSSCPVDRTSIDRWSGTGPNRWIHCCCCASCWCPCCFHSAPDRPSYVDLLCWILEPAKPWPANICRTFLLRLWMPVGQKVLPVRSATLRFPFWWCLNTDFSHGLFESVFGNHVLYTYRNIDQSALSGRVSHSCTTVQRQRTQIDAILWTTAVIDEITLQMCFGKT